MVPAPRRHPCRDVARSRPGPPGGPRRSRLRHGHRPEDGSATSPRRLCDTDARATSSTSALQSTRRARPPRPSQSEPGDDQSSVTVNGSGTADVRVAKAVTAPLALGGQVSFPITAPLGPELRRRRPRRPAAPGASSRLGGAERAFVATRWTVGSPRVSQSQVLVLTVLPTWRDLPQHGAGRRRISPTRSVERQRGTVGHSVTWSLAVLGDTAVPGRAVEVADRRQRAGAGDRAGARRRAAPHGDAPAPAGHRPLVFGR